MQEEVNGVRHCRTGWESWLARTTMAALLFEGATGLAITLLPFQAAIEWSLVAHTLAGVALLLPLAWYCLAHLDDYRTYPPSHLTVLGYLGLAALALCSVSGVVVTWQGLWGITTSSLWRKTHLISTLVTLVALLPHVLFSFLRVWRDRSAGAAVGFLAQTGGATVAGAMLIGGLAAVYSGSRYVNKLPQDYSFLYGTNRPFAPSLARTDTGGAFDARSLSGSESCGTAGCHEQTDVQEARVLRGLPQTVH